MAPPPTSPTSPRSPLSHRPLTPLSDGYFTSPVPDLASTLSTEAADRANGGIVSFLHESPEELRPGSHGSRTRVDPQRDPRRTPRLPAQPPVHSSPSQNRHETADDVSRRERLQRVLTRLNRFHEPLAASPLPYSNRTPSPHRQSLYDWAPSYNDNDPQDNELDAILNELRQQQPDTDVDWRRVLSQGQMDESGVPRVGSGTPAPATTAAEAVERRDRLRDRERRRRETDWVSLRTRAAIQRSRQEGSPSATERMLRYVMERERSGMSEEEERARGSGWFRPTPRDPTREEDARTPGWGLSPPANDAREAFRRGYLAENVPSRLPRVSTPPASAAPAPRNASLQFLENALKYLSDLRSIPSSEGMDEDELRDRESQVLGVSMDHELATKELWADKHDDFIMNLQSLEPLADSSWIQPGTVFDGHQHATSACMAQLARSRSGTVTHVLEQIDPNFTTRTTPTNNAFDHPPGSTSVAPFDASRPWLSHRPVLPGFHSPSGGAKAPHPDSHHDQWPVRVIIHSVNAADMTLQGTMEAYDVPQHSLGSRSMLNPAPERPKAGKRNAPIVTYLEGHIIDLTTHSFLTPEPPRSSKTATTARTGTNTSRHAPPSTSPDLVFPSASPQSDAANWRKLPPFSTLPSDDDFARLLLSTARMTELNRQYIFMRWKERCFVHGKDSACSEADTGLRHGDQDRGHGLTISGFYYVSLRRADGVVEGLYFDPSSTPYQHVRLRGSTRGWPAVAFR
ncbi:hypothetical protein LTR53_012992 [Teratosphaeriaceae sp. CCFEE 6253]|nr:hypothetical protein LTR53_012992 [Teratosphaeriaceae sp. CCFEE 6253]